VAADKPPRRSVPPVGIQRTTDHDRVVTVDAVHLAGRDHLYRVVLLTQVRQASRMQIDAAAPVTARPLEIETAAATAETDGYDGFGVPETRHDAFASLTLAARRTSRITLQSAIAVAFARNPMNVAVLANDIQLISHGRFQLGLGSQVRPHIERRFGMPWSHPASRMEEFISAVRAIWECWATGGRLDFRGEFYHHTLMTEFLKSVRDFNECRDPQARLGQRTRSL
jgi:alkanesulfonate monooxygenase SsuD/methylene tetrahydromethanopterin reductase-like flavin-dependent oxidoreductase (luciferase family)